MKKENVFRDIFRRTAILLVPQQASLPHLMLASKYCTKVTRKKSDIVNASLLQRSTTSGKRRSSTFNQSIVSCSLEGQLRRDHGMFAALTDIQLPTGLAVVIGNAIALNGCLDH